MMTLERLRELYGHPSGRAAQKELKALEPQSINYIRTSPFCVIATHNQAGACDVSPRGGKPGFVHIHDGRQLVIPDSKGNKRIDSLTNIVETGRIALLFFIPGVDETLRVNGHAEVVEDPKWLDLFPGEQNPPKTCLLISPDQVFLHCAKALMRSKLWLNDTQIDRQTFPTMAQMINAQLAIEDEPESQTAMLARYQKDL